MDADQGGCLPPPVPHALHGAGHVARRGHAGALGWALHDAEEQTVYQPQAETADAYEEAYAAYRRVYEALYLQKG